MRQLRLGEPRPFLERAFWSFVIVLWVVMIIAMLAVLASTAARSFNDGRYVQSQLSNWFKSLRDDRGIPCCDVADGTRLDDPDWEFNGASYRVRIDGDWLAVPPQAVLKAPNRVGYAVVWPAKDSAGQTHIRCFLPGSAS